MDLQPTTLDHEPPFFVRPSDAIAWMNERYAWISSLGVTERPCSWSRRPPIRWTSAGADKASIG